MQFFERKSEIDLFWKGYKKRNHGSKKFWSTVKPFLSSKGFIHNNDITIEINNKTIKDKSELAQTFNSHYINIVESTIGKHPTKLETLASRISEKEIVATIIDKFKNHPSIISNKNEFRPTAELNIKAATVDQINKIIRSLDTKRAARPDKILVKVVKMSAHIIDKHLTNIINNDLLRNSFSDSAKRASVRPIFKEGERIEIGNYRPVSILNYFSKSMKRSYITKSYLFQMIFYQISSLLPEQDTVQMFYKTHWKLENNARQKYFYWSSFDRLI